MSADTKTTAVEKSGEGSQPILVWDAKEFAEYARGSRWYWLVGAVGVLAAIGMLFFRQWTAAAVFLLATYVVIQHADDKPRQLTYSITKLGVNVGDKFYPYNELKMFWLIYKPPVKTLTLQTINRFRPLVKIDLAELDPLAVRNALQEYLPEDTKHEEDFLDRFSRFIRL